MHEHLTTYPLFGDSTSNQALIFSPPFESPLPEQPPSYPNYTLPVANISLPTPPLSYPNFTLVVSPTSASLTSFPQTGCQLSQVPSAWTAINQTLWLRDEEGWRSQWLLEGLLPMTNYTVYVVQDQTKVGGPAYFNTKSGLCFSMLPSLSTEQDLIYMIWYSIIRLPYCALVAILPRSLVRSTHPSTSCSCHYL